MARSHVQFTLDDASGAYELFPYRLEHVRGLVDVQDDYVDIKQVTARHGAAALLIDGRVGFGKNKPIAPKLRIIARDVPIDKDFLAAVPPEPRAWIESSGLTGALDIDGQVFRPATGEPLAALTSSPGTQGSGESLNPESRTLNPPSIPEITYNLKLSLRDGAVFRVGDVYALHDLSGEADLTPQQLTLRGLKARRDKALRQRRRHPEAA